MGSYFRPLAPSVSDFPFTLHLASLGLFSLLCACLALPARAASANETSPASDEIAQLELRASQANPREQCFLYTQLIDTMTAKAGKEISDGDEEEAASTLKQIDRYAHIIQANLARNTKRLKDAQKLLSHSTYRLAQCLHLASGDGKQTVQDTLKQLDLVNDQLLTQVFQH